MEWLVKKHDDMRGSGNMSFLWSWFSWIAGKFFLPFTIPLMFLCSYKKKNIKKRLQGKIVLITGASSGLGECLAHELYQAGCRLILASRRKNELTRVSHDLMRLHVTVTTFPPVVLELDLANLTSIPELASRALAVYGRVDVLINNGGISYRGEAKDTALDVDIKVMCVNYFGQIALTKAILPSMLEKNEGHIVSVSSVQGRIAIPHRSCYAASKHALQAFMDSLRAELSNTAIQVTVVNPGYIQTDLSLNAVTATGERYSIMDATTASGMRPEEAARKIVDIILQEKKEATIASLSPRLVIFLRTLAPSVYFYIMGRRARRLSPKKTS